MVLRFNTNGHCLISKQTGIKLTEKLKGIKYPQRAKTYDIVEIGHNFKPEEYNTRILTFKDKNGKILQRNITEKTPDDIIETKKNYKEYPITYIEDPYDVFRDLEVKGRKISSVTKKNGEYFSKSEEIQTIADTSNKPVVTISKIETSPTGFSGLEEEKQSIYEYKKGRRKGFWAGNYIRNNHAGIFKFSDFKTQSENMNYNPGNEKYGLLFIYPLKQFKRVAPYIIENPEHKPPSTIIKWYSKYPDKTISRGFYNGTVNLNRKGLFTKSDVVRTTAHEKEHAYQSIERHKPIEEHTEEIKKNIDAHKNYVDADKNFEEYKNNYNEVKAREAGNIAINEYKTSLDKLRNEFMYAPDYHFGFYE